VAAPLAPLPSTIVSQGEIAWTKREKHRHLEEDHVCNHTVRFPVTCPICGRESLAEVRLATLAKALGTGADLVLSPTCHELSWAAGNIEREQIQEYFAAVGPVLNSGSTAVS
jgi:hypothetical protein